MTSHTWRATAATAAASLLLSLSSLPSLTSAQTFPPPNPCSGDCFTHDPTILKRESDGLYFRSSSTDGLGLWTSSDLSGPWTRTGDIINVPSIINMDGNSNLWAPDLMYMRGTYYAFYSVSTSGSQTSAIGVATSPSMDAGTWTDQGAVASSTGASPYNCIDPNVYNGTGPDEFYMIWGSYWQGTYQTRLAIDGPNVFRSGNEQQIAIFPEGNHPQEGATVYIKDGVYWLFLSRGLCCTYDVANDPVEDLYRIVVGRSDSPTGPFVDKDGVDCRDGGGTLVLATQDNIYAPGGQGVFYDDAHGDVLYYHYLDSSVSVDYSASLFGWNVLNWVDGWPTLQS